LLGCYQLLLLPKANSLTKGVVLSSKATTKNSFRVVQILKQIYPYFQLLFSHKLPTYHRLHTYQFISFSPPPLRVSLILVVGTPQAPHRSALHDLVGGWELSVAASPARGSPPPRPRRRAGAALPVRRDNMTPLPHRHPRVGLPRP
jgi:hypothetical protein